MRRGREKNRKDKWKVGERRGREGRHLPVFFLSESSQMWKEGGGGEKRGGKYMRE